MKEPHKEPNKLLCLDCQEWTEFKPDLTCCPHCQSVNIPAADIDYVNISITWHELRVLVMWAEQYASKHKNTIPNIMNVVYGIADRLTLQHEDSRPLTFAGEVSQLRSVYGSENVIVVNNETDIPPSNPNLN